MSLLLAALVAAAPAGHPTVEEQARLSAPDVGECRWIKKTPAKTATGVKSSKPVKHKATTHKAQPPGDDWVLVCTEPGAKKSAETLIDEFFPPAIVPPPVAQLEEVPALIPATPPCECFAGEAPVTFVGYPVLVPGPAIFVGVPALPGVPAPVPEPEAIYLLLAGFAAIVVVRRRA